MNRLDKTIDDIRYTLECLTVLREIQETGDCNICKNRECAYRPKPGQIARYNCPFYIKTESDEVDTTEKVNEYVWCNTCEHNYLETECLGCCAKFDEDGNLIGPSNYKKDESLVDKIDAEIAKRLETRETENTKELYIVSEERNYWQKAIKLTEEQARAIEWFINVTHADYYIKKASDVEEEVI